jgi:diguanylate cyclase (GGDEF)-like protein
LPNTSAKQAIKMAERVRLAVERENCQIQDHTINTTVSIGVATYSEDRSELKTILKQADDSMYEAKKQGRNRVVFLE